MTNEVMMIPTQEFERLQDFYKGQISESALLNKASRLAAEIHLILKNPKIPSATAVKMVKPLARDQVRLTKRIAWPMKLDTRLAQQFLNVEPSSALTSSLGFTFGSYHNSAFSW